MPLEQDVAETSKRQYELANPRLTAEEDKARAALEVMLGPGRRDEFESANVARRGNVQAGLTMGAYPRTIQTRGFELDLARQQAALVEAKRQFNARQNLQSQGLGFQKRQWDEGALQRSLTEQLARLELKDPSAFDYVMQVLGMATGGFGSGVGGVLGAKAGKWAFGKDETPVQAPTPVLPPPKPETIGTPISTPTTFVG